MSVANNLHNITSQKNEDHIHTAAEERDYEKYISFSFFVFFYVIPFLSPSLFDTEADFQRQMPLGLSGL